MRVAINEVLSVWSALAGIFTSKPMGCIVFAEKGARVLLAQPT